MKFNKILLKISNIWFAIMLWLVITVYYMYFFPSLHFTHYVSNHYLLNILSLLAFFVVLSILFCLLMKYLLKNYWKFVMVLIILLLIIPLLTIMKNNYNWFVEIYKILLIWFSGLFIWTIINFWLEKDNI